MASKLKYSARSIELCRIWSIVHGSRSEYGDVLMMIACRGRQPWRLYVLWLARLRQLGSLSIDLSLTYPDTWWPLL